MTQALFAWNLPCSVVGKLIFSVICRTSNGALVRMLGCVCLCMYGVNDESWYMSVCVPAYVCVYIYIYMMCTCI